MIEVAGLSVNDRSIVHVVKPVVHSGFYWDMSILVMAQASSTFGGRVVSATRFVDGAIRKTN